MLAECDGEPVRDGSALGPTFASSTSSFGLLSPEASTSIYAYVAATVGVLLAGLLTKAGDGHDDRLAAQETWLIVRILTVGYMISRGLAKSGSREPSTDDTGSNYR